MAIRPLPDFNRRVYDILGLPFDAVDLASAVRTVLDCIVKAEPLFISTPNLNFLIAARKDPEFRRSVCVSDLSLADGMPIVLLARLLGTPIAQRVAGSDLFEALCAQTERTVKVYFFGGPDGAARAAGEKINELAARRRRLGKQPGVWCVGFQSPGFGGLAELSAPEVIDRINAAGADFVVVALGARKGQAWIERNRARLNAPVISHLGAVVNMTAGTISRAPRWIQKAGLEWMWRIKEEPLLWRRYGNDGAVLLRLLLSEVLPVILQRWLWEGGRAMVTHPAEIRQASDAGSASLHGVWTGAACALLRAWLDSVARSGLRPVLDVRAARYIDAETRGLIAIAMIETPPAIGCQREP